MERPLDILVDRLTKEREHRKGLEAALERSKQQEAELEMAVDAVRKAFGLGPANSNVAEASAEDGGIDVTQYGGWSMAVRKILESASTPLTTAEIALEATRRSGVANDDNTLKSVRYALQRLKSAKDITVILQRRPGKREPVWTIGGKAYEGETVRTNA